MTFAATAVGEMSPNAFGASVISVSVGWPSRNSSSVCSVRSASSTLSVVPPRVIEPWKARVLPVALRISSTETGTFAALSPEPTSLAPSALSGMTKRSLRSVRGPTAWQTSISAETSSVPWRVSFRKASADNSPKRSP